MHSAHRRLILFLAASLLIPLVSQAADNALSIPNVAQKILEDEGYRFFNFSSDAPVPLLLTATLDDRAVETFEIRPSKDVVLAIKLGDGNRVQAVRLYYAAGSEVRRYAAGLGETTFMTVGFSNPIEIDKPFLFLKSPQSSLEFKLSKK